MELWIRSQNKCKLRKTDIVNYSYEEGKHNIDCHGYSVGTYKSKQRCLEIIDEIQELLKLGNPENSFMHINNCNMCYDDIQEMVKRARETKAVVTDGADFEIVMPRVVTYEMPKN